MPALEQRGNLLDLVIGRVKVTPIRVGGRAGEQANVACGFLSISYTGGRPT